MVSTIKLSTIYITRLYLKIMKNYYYLTEFKLLLLSYFFDSLIHCLNHCIEIGDCSFNLYYIVFMFKTRKISLQTQLKFEM